MFIKGGDKNAILKVQNRFIEMGVEVITDDKKNVHVSRLSKIKTAMQFIIISALLILFSIKNI